jgi:hypothetical protein
MTPTSTFSFLDQMSLMSCSNLYYRPLFKCLRTKTSQLSRFNLLFLAGSAFKALEVATFGVIRTVLLET